MGTNKERGIWWIRKGKKRRKEKGKKKIRESKQGKRGEESDREREKQKMGIFLVFRWSNPDGPRVKVNPRIAGYAWVPIYWSFVKLCEVENFLT